MRLKIGMRVVCNSDYENRATKGLQGVVADYTEHACSIGVSFDKYIGGHSCDGTCEGGHGWYVPVQYLVPVISSLR